MYIKLTHVVVLAILGLPTVALTVEPAPDVTVEGNGRWADTYLDLDGSNTRPDSSPIPAKGVSYPLVRTSISPGCDANTELGPTLLCGGEICGDNERTYIAITERIESEGATPQVTEELRCGIPDRNLETLALEEFYRTEVQLPTPLVHPGNGLTLVNFPNVYATDFDGYEQSADIENADVQLKFIPVRYIWNFGDGETLSTTDPGKPYDPDLTDRVNEIQDQYPTTYQYTETGDVTTTVTIIIGGEFSVNGGDWQPISGSIQATSPGFNLNIAEARGELILPEN